MKVSFNASLQNCKAASQPIKPSLTSPAVSFNGCRHEVDSFDFQEKQVGRKKHGKDLTLMQMIEMNEPVADYFEKKNSKYCHLLSRLNAPHDEDELQLINDNPFARMSEEKKQALKHDMLTDRLVAKNTLDAYSQSIKDTEEESQRESLKELAKPENLEKFMETVSLYHEYIGTINQLLPEIGK